MKIINPNVELLPISTTYDEMMRDIERAAEICVASTKRHDPVEDYINNSLIKRRHYRPLEFGTAYVEVDFPSGVSLNKEDYTELMFWEQVEQNHWTRIKRSSNYSDYITTNCRVLQEAWDYLNNLYLKELDDIEKGKLQITTLSLKPWQEYVKNRWCYTKEHEKRYTFLWEISRATADSFRTHIMISSLMQSTRYCNFARDKFGSEITFIRPAWFEHDYEKTKYGDFTPHEHLLIRAWKNAEDYYLSGIKLGMQAQHARAVLPLEIRTEFIQCAYIDAWDNFFNQRAHNSTGPAHDDAQLIATKAELLYKKNK
jgi:thymidylate synthase (FAD)